MKHNTMIIDDKVIFVHCPRTSGTSIRRALLKGQGPNDPENLQEVGALHKGLFWNNQKHSYASMIKDNIDPEIWQTRLKFSVVRNPWDRMVSLFGLFKKRHVGNKIKANKFLLTIRDLPDLKSKAHQLSFINKAMELSFEEWIDFCMQRGWDNYLYLGEDVPLIQIPQNRWFDGLDKIFKFENREEIDNFLVDMGYEVAVPENQSEKRDKDWRSYYNARTYDLVAEWYREDINRFGYGG
jgi:hypothetical protein